MSDKEQWTKIVADADRGNYGHGYPCHCSRCVYDEGILWAKDQIAELQAQLAQAKAEGIHEAADYTAKYLKDNPEFHRGNTLWIVREYADNLSPPRESK